MAMPRKIIQWRREWNMKIIEIKVYVKAHNRSAFYKSFIVSPLAESGCLGFVINYSDGSPMTEDVFKTIDDATNWAIEFLENHAEEL